MLLCWEIGQCLIGFVLSFLVIYVSNETVGSIGSFSILPLSGQCCGVFQ